MADRRQFFVTLNEYKLESVLELGCNAGANLEAMEDTLSASVVGCDINNLALDIANKKGLIVLWDDATDLDIDDNDYEMVFTSGVLIHLKSPDMIRCMKEMNRVSSRMVMMIEYMGDDIEIPYRGKRSALFKRDYGGIYSVLFPEAELVRTGFLPREMGFDDVTYWIFDGTSDCTSENGVEKIARESDDGSGGPDVAPPLDIEADKISVG